VHLRLLLPLTLIGCLDTESGPVQAPIYVHLVVHVDPLARIGGEDCDDDELSPCGELAGDTFVERTRNLSWLAETWTAAGRTMDLELGPEAAFAWAGEPDHISSLTRTLIDAGDTQAVATLEDARGLADVAIRSLLDGGNAELSVHVHEVLRDASGLWGAASLGTEGADPCAAWSADPMAEANASEVEAVVAYGVAGAAAIAEPLGVPLINFTGHMPRTLAGKAQVVSDPDGLDPETSSGFSASFAPQNLGSGYSECLIQQVDHPPFETYGSDSVAALVAGDGPAQVPGERVLGSMDIHLGVAADGSTGAAQRRFLQLLLNWRVAALEGDADRPWTWTFHEHLFDLSAGEPAPKDPNGRFVGTRVGNTYRSDLLAMAELMDRWSGRADWQGASVGQGGGVVRWVLPSDVVSRGSTGSQFSYGEADEAPLEGLDSAAFPYLPLVARVLAQSHLVCTGLLDDSAAGGARVEGYGLDRCATGWTWGRDATWPGYTCTGGEAPERVYVLVPDGPACVAAPDGLVRAGAVDALELGAPDWCGAGMELPVVGLMAEVGAGTNWPGLTCTTGWSAVF
jgi:hypothetical protein